MYVRDCSFYKSRHDCYTQTASRDNKNFDQFSLPLEILSHHQRTAVSRHSNPNSYERKYTDDSNLFYPLSLLVGSDDNIVLFVDYSVLSKLMPVVDFHKVPRARES